MFGKTKDTFIIICIQVFHMLKYRFKYMQNIIHNKVLCYTEVEKAFMIFLFWLNLKSGFPGTESSLSLNGLKLKF